MTVRAATGSDAHACAGIYAPFVRDTAITFEVDPPTPEEMVTRIATAARTHAWLVSERGARVIGYAYGGPMKSRAAYRWSCEVSVYVEPGWQRGGVGRELYEALFDRLAARGYRTVIAGMAVPNAASEALHRAVGFEPVGVFRRVGWKHDRWHDVAWLQRPLAAGDEPPAELR